MTSPTRSKEADAVAILRSGGPFAEAMEQTHLSFDEVKAAWDRAQKPQQPHAIKAASLPIIAESLTSAAKHAYAATWVEGGAREHLVKLMLNDSRSPHGVLQSTSAMSWPRHRVWTHRRASVGCNKKLRGQERNENHSRDPRCGKIGWRVAVTRRVFLGNAGAGASHEGFSKHFYLILARDRV